MNESTSPPAATDTKVRTGSPETSSNVQPLKPHPVLFYALLTIYLLWMLALVVMYFTTVRNSHSSTPADRPATTQVGLPRQDG